MSFFLFTLFPGLRMMKSMSIVESRAISLTSVKSILATYGPVTLAFFLPFFLHDNQLLTGTLINFLLFVSPVFFSRQNQRVLIFAPSLGTISRNLLFGSATRYLILFLPFIWLGNYLLIYIFDHLRLKTKPVWAIGAAALAKASVLSLSARSLVKQALVPTIFLDLMSLNQLITATLGGMIACLFVICNHKLHVKFKH